MFRIRKNKGIWNFNNYMEYIESVKDSIPIGIRDFVTDKKRYVFYGKDTLYDAQLISIQFRKNGICILWVSPYYDRTYKFVFKEISKLVMNAVPDKLTSLLIHEFAVKDKDIYNYRFLFFCGTEIRISCSKINIYEQCITESLKKQLMSRLQMFDENVGKSGTNDLI